MDYINTTALRTDSKRLIEALRRGESIELIYRSKVVADITPKKAAKPLTTTDITELQKIAKELNLPKLSYKEREKRYHRHLMKKYGKGLS